MKKIIFLISFAACLLPLTPLLAAPACEQGKVCLDNPLTVEAQPAQLIGLIIKSALGLVGGLALAMAVWGGFQWLTAAGNKEKIDSGAKTMLWAVIGLILSLASFLLVDTILGFLAGRPQ